MNEYGGAGYNNLEYGTIMYELSIKDASIATFFGTLYRIIIYI